MTAEGFIHSIITWVLGADSKEECVKRFEAVINNPKLAFFVKDYSYREMISREILKEVEKNNG